MSFRVFTRMLLAWMQQSAQLSGVEPCKLIDAEQRLCGVLALIES
ncbi:hypothetical protein [Alcaligenes faecalis]|nr:hypothetical protein [Alcaligenes faecalis]